MLVHLFSGQRKSWDGMDPPLRTFCCVFVLSQRISSTVVALFLKAVEEVKNGVFLVFDEFIIVLFQPKNHEIVNFYKYVQLKEQL